MQDNENKRINAGYEIIATLPVGDVEFVVGQNVHAPAMFVTWEYQKQRGYYWGHYMTDKDAAMRDMYERAEAELSFKKSVNTREKKKKDEREER